MTSARAQESNSLPGLDELDTKIINALQVWPRAPWSVVGEVVHVDPVTVARRWQRLQESGVAWVFGHPSTTTQRQISAIVELKAKPKWMRDVLAFVESNPNIYTVRVALGEWNLSLDWRGESSHTFERFVSDELATVSGVKEMRSFIHSKQLIDGSSWTLQALSRQQIDYLRRGSAAEFSGIEASDSVHDIDLVIRDGLAQDGRLSLAKLAAMTGASVTTVKRHLGHMMLSRQVMLRCEVSRAVSGWPISTKFFANVPVHELQRAADELARMPEVRSCYLLVGSCNVMITAWLRSIADIMPFEVAVKKRIGSIEIEDRSVVSRFSKLMGVRIDPDGMRSSPPGE